MPAGRRGKGAEVERSAAQLEESRKRAVILAEEMRSAVAPVRIEAGVIVARQGDRGRRFYFVESGALDVVVTSEDGLRLPIARLGPGSHFAFWRDVAPRRCARLTGRSSSESVPGVIIRRAGWSFRRANTVPCLPPGVPGGRKGIPLRRGPSVASSDVWPPLRIGSGMRHGQPRLGQHSPVQAKERGILVIVILRPTGQQ
jgi:hypothetical protein